MTQDLVVNSGRNLIIEQIIYFLQAVQIDDIIAHSSTHYPSYSDDQLLLTTIFIMVIRLSKS